MRILNVQKQMKKMPNVPGLVCEGKVDSTFFCHLFSTFPKKAVGKVKFRFPAFPPF
jgi:hypothetical protein